MKIILAIPVLAAIATLACNASTGAMSVSRNDVLDIAGKTGSPLILDVRTPGEYAEGHVPHARNVPHDTVEQRLDELADGRDAGVIVYCESGRRAGIVAGVLAKAGFTDIRHMAGDMQGWRSDDLPMEKGAR